MNEVRSTQIASQLLANSASLKGASENVVSTSGKKLPSAVGNSKAAEKVEQPKAEQPNVRELQSAVANVSDYVQSLQRDLQFSVDEELDKTVIRVLDGDSGEVIRQIPEDIFLELARRLKDDGEFRLLNALG